MMSRLRGADAKRHDPEPVDESRPDLGVLCAGGPFERYPGAVAVLAPDGRVLAANLRADPLVRLLQENRPPQLHEALEAAFDGRPAQVAPLLIAADPGAGQPACAYDLVVLPWPDLPAALLLGRDITLERSLRNALIESRQRYKHLVEACSDFAWETDAEGRFTFVSSAETLGFETAELVGARVVDFLAEGDRFEDSPFAARQAVDGPEVWFGRAGGQPSCLRVVALPLVDRQGGWRGARGLCRDITAERQRERELAAAHHRERLLAHILRVIGEELDPASMLAAAAAALVPALPAAGAVIVRQTVGGRLLSEAAAGSAPPGELLNRALRSFAAAEEDERCMGGEDGGLLLLATRWRDVRNGALCLWRAGRGAVWNDSERRLAREVASQVGLACERLAHKKELERLSSTDTLTGLLNRRAFKAGLEHCLTHPTPVDGGALLFVDLDNFKLVNDRRGHAEGDRVLTVIAEILRAQSGDADLAARLGGDEFALFLAGADQGRAECIAQQVLRAVGALNEGIGDPAEWLGASIGIALLGRAAQESLGALLARADQAMYRAKRQGKNRIRLAAPAGAVAR